jgi:hypothetical protein
MSTRTLFMETTTVAAERTCGEVSQLLIQGGARSISMDYEEGGRIVGMRFLLLVNGAQHAFRMPVRSAPIFKILNGRRKSTHDRQVNAAKDREQSERVAWRQLLRWTQAQMALLDCGMAAAAEVYLPYLIDHEGHTVYELFEESRYKALPEAKGA